ncbi:putative oxidative stress protein Svf1 [Talaromyces proteolyticus]|uniref:Ceramide-binding protein SVF1 n=1 Tax=Talaromyces proteolyticus TaxID=1131652 RepID=A0AAD4L5T7_9EURO|nr:putative oxidative stress protein Svf1 [Talaromyces proteolyticus]KAH8705125.1 putative oxidative stress protein Svf1 [Talaromyces proteolyticus]
MNWFKQTLANVVGTEEPIYGPEAIQSVAKQAESTPYTELKKEDLKWVAPQYTSVETQTFYVMADNGALAMVQLIYNNIAGLHTTCQFNTKIFSFDSSTPHLWHSNTLSNHLFDPDMYSFGADNLAMTLNEDGTAYTIKSAVNEASLVNLTFTRQTPGVAVGNNGTSYFGTDPSKPWGSMRHAFWPRCSVEGTITTKEKTYDLKGRGFFAYALQGMKPHHAAARWNFVNFQTPTYSAFLMEYTTPPSYGSTVVNVGGVLKDGEILYAGTSNSAQHLEIGTDSENDWPEPKAIRFTWDGKTKDEDIFHAEVEGPLKRLDRIDVMAEVPGFVKSIVGSVAGTKPYIYQYYPQNNPTLKVKVGDTEHAEEGTLFCEATFIS